MVISVARVLLRRPVNVTRSVIRSTARFESTATKAAETTSTKASQAIDGLSRVKSAAGPAISNAANGLGKALGKIGGRTGSLIVFIQPQIAEGNITEQIPRVIYYGRVGLELSKLVFHGQKMAPPPMTTFQAYFHRVIEKVRNPSTLLTSSTNPQAIFQRARNISSSELATGATICAELLGFFTVGEILGRFKLVGYQGQITHH